MINKKLLSVVLIVVSVVFGHHTYAESSVWKISKGENYFYLGGTIHLLSPEDFPLPNEFMIAFEDSTKLILETDLASAETPEFQQKIMSVMSYNDGKQLKDDLSEESYLELEKFLISRNISY